MSHAMRHLLLMILVTLSTPVRAEMSETSEFLQLSGDRQAAYVAGILQGMSYVMLNYDRAGYDKWDACVRAQSLEAIVVDVLHLLKDNPNESHNPVPWAVTRAVSQRC
jgi:hypothetical protein